MFNNFESDNFYLYMGITFDEYERSNAIDKNWKPYEVSYPLCWGAFISQDLRRYAIYSVLST